MEGPRSWPKILAVWLALGFHSSAQGGEEGFFCQDEEGERLLLRRRQTAGWAGLGWAYLPHRAETPSLGWDGIPTWMGDAVRGGPAFFGLRWRIPCMEVGLSDPMPFRFVVRWRGGEGERQRQGGSLEGEAGLLSRVRGGDAPRRPRSETIYVL